MRCLDPEYVRRAYPLAVAALPRPADAFRLVYVDGYIYLLDVKRHGYSMAFWLPLNKIWAPYVRKVA